MENDSITKYNRQRGAILSPPKLTAIQNWREQPKQYYATLLTTTPRKMIEAETPTLWDIRQQLGHPAAVAILVNAFIHAAKLVNFEKNLTVEQIGEAANDILESKGYFKVEEIKYLLKRALRTQNIYGRLDYNVLMNWVEQYDAERTDEAMRISEQHESQELNKPDAQMGSMTFKEYVADLERRAPTDPKAAQTLAEIRKPKPAKPSLLSREERAEHEREFQRYRMFEYLSKKSKK